MRRLYLMTLVAIGATGLVVHAQETERQQARPAAASPGRQEGGQS